MSGAQAHEAESFVLGLVGIDIEASLTPAMQVREGRAQGLTVSYRIIDAGRRGLGVDGLPALLDWAERLGFDGLNVTHPFKQAVVPLLDDLSDDAEDLGAVNTVVFRHGRRLGTQHRLVGLQPRLPADLGRRRARPGGAGRRRWCRCGRRVRAARPGR